MKALVIVALLAGLGFPVHQATAAVKDDIAACAVSLTPEITLINSSRSLKTSWLLLVSESTYEFAKQEITSIYRH